MVQCQDSVGHMPTRGSQVVGICNPTWCILTRFLPIDKPEVDMNFGNRLADLGLRIERVRERAQVLSELAEALEEEHRLIAHQRDLWTRDQKLALDLDGAESANPNFRKSNVQIYEDILLENGSPMHVTRVLETALLRGAELKGKRPPVDQVRNALSRCKRFSNVGGNTWWIAAIPLPPDTSAPAGRVSSSETPSLEAEGDTSVSQLPELSRRVG